MLGLCLIADPLLIYAVVFIPPPVRCGCVLCYWVRWIYQGRRVGQFTHQGDNYRVIGVLTLSALTIFVSSLLASPLHKRTQHAWYWKSTKKKEKKKSCLVPGSWPSYLLDLGGPVWTSCVCLTENMRVIVYRCFALIYTTSLCRTQETAHWISALPPHLLLLLP